MGFIEPDRHAQAYERIREDAANSFSTSVLLLVANDPDALCAARILTHLLKEDFIPHQIRPVSGYMDVVREAQELILPNPEITSIVMLNCGGLADIHSILQLDEHRMDRRTVYVCDCRRPIHLTNLFGEMGVQVFLGKNEGSALSEERDAFLLLSAEAIEEDAGEEEEEEEEDWDNSELEALSISQNSESPARSRKRPSPTPANMDGKRKARQEKTRRHASARHLLDNYYNQGTWEERPCSAIMYGIASALRRSNRSLLWWGIVGMTDQYIHDRCPNERYALEYHLAMEETTTTNSSSTTESTSAQDVADALSTQGAEDRIESTDELRFTLFRHWSLYDAMYHSRYVATRLGIWKERGRSRLLGFLTRLGCSREQAQEPFTHLDAPLKRKLLAALRSERSFYRLEDLEFPSFTRRQGFRGTLAAGDVAWGLIALLGCGSEAIGRIGGVWSGVARTGNSGSYAPMSYSASQPPSSSSTQWYGGFWRAWDALERDELLRAGVSLSLGVHREVVRQVSSVMTGKHLLRGRNFSQVIITENDSFSASGLVAPSTGSDSGVEAEEESLVNGGRGLISPRSTSTPATIGPHSSNAQVSAPLGAQAPTEDPSELLSHLWDNGASLCGLLGEWFVEGLRDGAQQRWARRRDTRRARSGPRVKPFVIASPRSDGRGYFVCGFSGTQADAK
ncbi:CDC45-like protein-domain-containing protein [Piptocephalis cylindrospora]|uniref:CDC45-like protein-domain-containing protein n=1 Tax=Piptocephalis cylindrospora TaxID=1907219 RepID=A0A4P9Y405_9FUNG|nr:CDC45-like protein-domain-containing protein [Piptocephalis cylindrospora]|eukprot:RKP13698.1 CDC45-like protein-domain-containing protein [Piptocephalis cylindrospora]